MRIRTTAIILTLFLAGLGTIGFLLSRPAPEAALPRDVQAAEAAPTAAALPPAAQIRQPGSSVALEALVVPARSAALTFELTGVPITEVFVQEGDVVEAGAPLARLDTRELQLRVDQAEASVARARADYDRLLETATPARIAQARAQVAQAEARLRQVEASVTSQDVAAARARLDEAQARLAELQAGPRSSEVAIAQSVLDRAQINLTERRNSLAAAKTVAQSRMEQVANELRNAQTAYSQIYWEVRALENNPNANQRALQEARTREEVALRAVQNAEEALEQARVALNEAQQNEITGIQAAEAQVRDAQANLDRLFAGATPDQIAGARAQVADAQAALARLQGQSRQSAIDAARAEIADAQARLDDLLTGPSPAELARAAAAIEELEVLLKQQQLGVERATLFAPISGVVAAVNVRVGEMPRFDVTPFVLADISEWQLESNELSDENIVRVRAGDPAIITFYALPGEEFTGTVKRMQPLGQSDRGETLYTVIVTLDEQDARLRWNMVGQAVILIDN
jgi:HlyD family secretion protein